MINRGLHTGTCQLHLPCVPWLLSSPGGFPCHVCTALPQLPINRSFSLLKSRTLFPPHLSPLSRMSYISSLTLSHCLWNFYAYVNIPCSCIKTLFSLVNLFLLIGLFAQPEEFRRWGKHFNIFFSLHSLVSQPGKLLVATLLAPWAAAAERSWAVDHRLQRW